MKDYKEALKDIVNIIKATEKSDIGFVNICSYLDTNCPELMKSKDDIMREKIIATIHLYYGKPLEDEAKEMIVWLKEQGEKDKLIQELSEYKVKYTQEVLGKYLHNISHKDDESLEKQGEQKSQRMICAEAKEALFDFKDDIQLESDDKVEPKFKVGDWVVRKDGENFCNGCKFAQITNIDDDKRHWFDSDSWLEKEEIRLWTIQDAKDGDVLAEDSCIFIIQKLGDNNTAAKTYCTLYDDGEFNDGSILYFDIDSTKPATKEQRDRLFQKMIEAGYGIPKIKI